MRVATAKRLTYIFDGDPATYFADREESGNWIVKRFADMDSPVEQIGVVIDTGKKTAARYLWKFADHDGEQKYMCAGSIKEGVEYLRRHPFVQSSNIRGRR